MRIGPGVGRNCRVSCVHVLGSSLARYRGCGRLDSLMAVCFGGPSVGISRRRSLLDVFLVARCLGVLDLVMGGKLGGDFCVMGRGFRGGVGNHVVISRGVQAGVTGKHVAGGMYGCRICKVSSPRGEVLGLTFHFYIERLRMCGCTMGARLLGGGIEFVQPCFSDVDSSVYIEAVGACGNGPICESCGRTVRFTRLLLRHCDCSVAAVKRGSVSAPPF